MKHKTIELISKLRKEEDVDNLYGMLIDIGKNISLTESEKQDLKNTIEEFLFHEDEQIRSAAIRVLGFYWGLKEYKQKSLEIFLNDQDDGTKADALMTWSNLYRTTNEKKVMEFLFSVLIDENQPLIVRDQAFFGILAVSPLEPSQWPRSDLNWSRFNESIDWDLVNQLIENAQSVIECKELLP